VNTAKNNFNIKGLCGCTRLGVKITQQKQKESTTKRASKPSESDTIKRDVKAVLSELVSIVEKEEKKCQPVRSETRRSLSNLEKIKALDDIEAGMLMVDVAFKHGVNKSMIS